MQAEIGEAVGLKQRQVGNLLAEIPDSVKVLKTQLAKTHQSDKQLVWFCLAFWFSRWRSIGQSIRCSPGTKFVPGVESAADSEVSPRQTQMYHEAMKHQGGARTDLVDNVNEVGRPAGNSRAYSVDRVKREWDLEILRRLGWTQREMGEALKLNQSNVSRGLCEIPDSVKSIKTQLAKTHQIGMRQAQSELSDVHACGRENRPRHVHGHARSGRATTTKTWKAGNAREGHTGRFSGNVKMDKDSRGKFS